MHALSIDHLTKVYSLHNIALDQVTINVKQGDFFALLGPNGAGKSTLINIVTGIIKKTSGTVMVNGFNIDTHPNQAKLSVGVVPQEFNFSIFERCIDIVVWQAGYFGISRSEAYPRAMEIFDKLGLFDKAHVYSRELSGGMKRRLMIARALIHRPKLLILDEPTAGVDIEQRRGMWEYLRELNQQGVTIILTTHYLEEAEELCKTMAIIHKGQIIQSGRVRDLLKSLKTETFIVESDKHIPSNVTISNGAVRRVSDTVIEVTVPTNTQFMQLVEQLTKQRIDISAIRQKGNRLEELFLQIIHE